MTVPHYTYDAANNRSTKAVTGGEEPGQWSYTSNTLNQLTGFTRTSGTTGPSSVSYGYDANGNRTSRTADGVSDAYTWDAENRLIGVTKAGAQHSYGYDYRTRRISREEPASGGGGTQKTAVIFAGGLSVAEYGYTGTALQAQPTVEYVRGPDLGGGVGGLLYSLRSAGGGGSFQPEAKYSYPNGRGDVVAQADQSGAVTWTASYEAFGTHKKETGTNADRQRANTKEEDPTGLLNEGFRYRDLETDTWLSRDPAGFVDGPNLYAYVKCNPWSKFDPLGLEGVVVSGQPGDHKNKEHFLVNGLDRASKMAKEFKDSGSKESAMWMIYNDGGKGGFSQKQLDSYQKKAEKAGVDFEVVSSTKKISEYVNEKTGGASRANDKVSRFSYIGHATPGDLDVGFIDHDTRNMMSNDSIKPSRDFKPGAFSDKSKINLVGGCRTDVADWFSDSAADQFRNSLVGKDSTVSGSTSRVYYPGGVVSDSQLPKPEGGTVKSAPGRYDPGASAAAAEKAARDYVPTNRAVE